MKEAEKLQGEMDQTKFFSAYSCINNSLEERFIELLLLMDSQNADFNLDSSFSVDFTEALDGLKNARISSKGTYSICANWKFGEEVTLKPKSG